MDESALPVEGSWTRFAVIRGDPVLGGVVLVVAGVGLAIATGLGLLPWPVLGVALVCGAVGLGLVRWSRATYRRLLADVVRRHADVDPGSSPVPWVDDDLWRERNAFDPELDGPVLLQAEIDPALRPFGRDATGAFTDPVLRPVSEVELLAARTGTLVADQAAPRPMLPDRIAPALAETPGRFLVVAPRWPVCCERPATLLTLRLDQRHADALVLGPEPDAPVDPAVHGQLGFQCRGCGRRYATDPAW
ncbi:MAG: hypothetical protein H6732_01355 [Alphaproteobacteria bacterium]|nr:hypothetical protein [Alphaproteobacteria bacterium]